MEDIMTSRLKNILIALISFVIIALLIFVVALSGRIPLNDESTVGNTAGNLNNNGYFCEQDGRVYFANAYDDYSLYSMNTDETDITKLHGGNTTFINVGGDYIYYVTTSTETNDSGSFRGAYGIYRSKTNGRDVTGMDRCYVAAMQLCGNYLYYDKIDAGTSIHLEKIKIDKKDQVVVDPTTMINPNCYVNGRIYYSGTTEDHYLRALNTSNDSISVVWEGNIWNPIYDGGYIYYMDVGNNYCLCRYSTYDGTVQTLTTERVDLFNVYGGYIYYQTNSSSPALMRMSVDGSAQETVRSGVHQNINITSQYVYFNAFGAPTPVYKTSTFGPVNVTTFDAGMQAALSEMK